MNELNVIEHNESRVLTTAQLAESYGTDEKRISENFNRNQVRYAEGKHFILLQGERLKQFKVTYPQIAEQSKRAPLMYLWTEKGAWLHAKSLNTDQAWDAYEKLVDEYYRIASGQFRLPATYKEALVQLLGRVEENEKLQTTNLVLTQQVHELKPKASYYDMVLQNKSLLSVSKIAKDYGMSAISLNKRLHALGVQFKQGDIWLLYAKYQDKGYTQTTTHVIDADMSRVSTKWTQKGRLFIYDLLKHEGVLPLIERELLESV